MDPWQRMSEWHLVIPPSRPSPEQLDHVRRHLGPIDRSASVAVLGSTPEFRDLLSELGFVTVFVFDKNLASYETMTAARVVTSPECFIHGDWVDTLTNHPDRFAAILSDLTSGNVEYPRRAQFYDVLQRALMSGGLFLDKILTNELPLLRLETIEEMYSWKPLNLQTVNYFSCEAIFCSELQSEGEIIDTSRFYDRLVGAFHSPRLLKFVAAAEHITPREAVWYYGRPWADLAKDYCPRLETLLAISMIDDGPYAGRVRHVVLRKPIGYG